MNKKYKVFGIQLLVSTEEQGLWWDSDMHHLFENQPEGKPGWGIKLALRGGSVVHPVGVAPQKEGDVEWKNNKWWNPKKIYKTRVPFPVLPFLSIALGKYGFYIGFKDYPVIHDNYKRWLDPENVTPDARALCFSASIRKTRTV